MKRSIDRDSVTGREARREGFYFILRESSPPPPRLYEYKISTKQTA
jgi:hypothetical protein